MKRNIHILFLWASILLFSQCAWSGRQYASEKADWSKRKSQAKSGPQVYRLKDIQKGTAKKSTASIRPPKKALMKQADTVKNAVIPSKDTLVLNTVPDTLKTLREWLTPDLWEKCFPKRYGVAEKGLNSKEQGCVDFYTYEAFMAAAEKFPRFLNEGTWDQKRRELAAFFAHITMETGGLRHKEQINKTKSYSIPNDQYPPMSEKDYYGRGPIQLSYNYNYGLFSEQCFSDKTVMLKDPDKILRDSVVAFSSAIWFWMTPQGYKPACHDVMVGNWIPQDADLQANRLPGFGLTLNIINAPQCGVDPAEPTLRRYQYFDDFCRLFGVDKGANCDCAQQTPFGKNKTAMSN